MICLYYKFFFFFLEIRNVTVSKNLCLNLKFNLFHSCSLISYIALQKCVEIVHFRQTIPVLNISHDMFEYVCLTRTKFSYARTSYAHIHDSRGCALNQK